MIRSKGKGKGKVNKAQAGKPEKMSGRVLGVGGLKGV